MAFERSSARRGSRSFSRFASFAALLLPLAVGAQEIRLGSEFQVNTYTADYSYQTRAAVAVGPDGDFVVVWASAPQDGEFDGVFAQQFSSAGVALASEFQVSIHTTGSQFSPAVAVSADGDFVVAWESTVGDGANYGIFARPFSSSGTALASEFQVNDYATSIQRYPAIATANDGSFVVAWQSYTQDGQDYGVFARRFSSAGAPLANELQINTYTLGLQRNPAVAAGPDGGFVVVWQDSVTDGSYEGVLARRFSSAGAALASEFQVNTHFTDNQTFPAVALAPDGELVVAWQSSAQDGSYDGIFARRFSNAGVPVTPEFLVNTEVAGNQVRPSVAVQGKGDFVVAWQSDAQDGSESGIFARRFSPAGGALASEFQVNTYTPGVQMYPSVAAAGARFVVAWQSSAPDSTRASVFAQRFQSPAVLDIDGNGSVTALTDGLLVVRFLFGFTGTTLTNGIVGASCTRCDAAAIQPYLQTLI